MLAMGLAMSLIMYVSASTSVGFMLGTRSGAAFENARDYLKLVALFYTLCFTGNRPRLGAGQRAVDLCQMEDGEKAESSRT